MKLAAALERLERLRVRDFTVSVYRMLVEVLQRGGYGVTGVAAFLVRGRSPGRVAAVRDDTGRSPADALAMAHLERELGVATTYYFRATGGVFSLAIMRESSWVLKRVCTP